MLVNNNCQFISAFECDNENWMDIKPVWIKVAKVSLVF